MSKNRVMSHIVGGYPTIDDSIELLLEMQRVGVFAVEVQIPFSDTSADGPEIMHANEVALENGLTVDRCFEMVKNAKQEGFNVTTFLMSYIQKIINYGVDDFCREASNCSIEGLIIPDLPVDSIEHMELSNACRKYQINLVPVLTPGMSEVRLQMYLKDNPRIIYVTSMRGITGSKLRYSKDLDSLIRKIKKEINCDVAVGFGVRTRSDAAQIMEIADIAVVGSVVIEALRIEGVSKAIEILKRIID